MWYNDGGEMDIKKLVLTAVLAGLALIIFVVEAQMPPIWIPGIKLGLANVVTLAAILFGGYVMGAEVLVIRIILGAVFCGTLMSFAFSLAGGIFAYAAMCIALRLLDKKQIWVASVFGATAHSLGQLCVAAAAIENVNVFILLPLMLIASIITGVFTGLCAQYLWFGPLKKFRL